MRNLKIIKIFILKNILRFIEYKKDFILATSADIIWAFSGLILIKSIYSNDISALKFSPQEFLFFYSYSLCSLGIYYMFFSNIQTFSEDYIYNGKLDLILTKPISTPFQIILDKLNLIKSGDFIVGNLLLFTLLPQLNLTIGKILILYIYFFISGFIYYEINAIFSYMSFFIIDRYGVTSALDNFRIFTKYPIDIYPIKLKSLLTFVLPYAFTSYYPSQYFIRGEKKFLIFTLVCLVLLFILSKLLWYCGIKRYSSLGG